MKLRKSIKNRLIIPWKVSHYDLTRMGKKLAKYKNAFSGRCFIIANGPSLSPEDLNRLAENDEVTFGMNRIYKLFDKTDWRPTFYVCEDEKIIASQQKEITAIPCQEKLIPIELHWWYSVSIDNALYFHLNYDERKMGNGGISEDCAKQIDCRGTVTVSCIQIALYMGFDEIILLGVDNNYQTIINENGKIEYNPNQQDYFCNDYDEDIRKDVVHDIGQNNRAYRDVKNYIQKTNKAVIRNATRGGKLEIFDRINFDSIFK